MMLNYELPYFRYDFSFFKEEIAHLEIAVARYIPPDAVNRAMRIGIPLVFEKTSTGLVLQSLKQADDWECGAQIAGRAGVAKKSLTNHFDKLRKLGHQIDVRRSRKGKEYRFKE